MVSHTQSVWQVKCLFLCSEHLQPRVHRWLLAGVCQSLIKVGDASQENPGTAPLYHAGVNGGQSIRLQLGLPTPFITRGAHAGQQPLQQSCSPCQKGILVQ